MNWAKTIFRELAGLFVDDGSLALAIVVWVGVCGGVLPHLALPGNFRAPLWSAGLMIILIGSVARRARSK